MSNKSIILIGDVGTGKTTLFNKICKESQPVSLGGDFITKQSFMKQSAYGNGFRVIDTPTFFPQRKKIMCVQAIQNALCEGPLNQIIFVVKLARERIYEVINKRNGHLFQKISQNSYSCCNPLGYEEEKKIQNEFSTAIEAYGIYSVIYLQKNDRPEQICTTIENILQKSQQLEIDIDILSNFDLIEISEMHQFELEFSKGDIECQFQSYYSDVINLIEKMDSQKENTSDILHYLLLFLKEQLKLNLKKFRKKNRQIFEEFEKIFNDRYLEYKIIFDFKKTLMKYVDNVADNIQKKIEQSPSHFFHSIKACPNCNLIWLKETNCRGVIRCGDFSLKDEYLPNQVNSKRYGFQLRNGAYEILEYEQFYSTQPQTKVYNPNLYQLNRKMGCGFKLIWNELPKLSETAIKALVYPGFLELFKQEEKQFFYRQSQYNKEKFSIMKEKFMQYLPLLIKQ